MKVLVVLFQYAKFHKLLQITGVLVLICGIISGDEKIDSTNQVAKQRFWLWIVEYGNMAKVLMTANSTKPCRNQGFE